MKYLKEEALNAEEIEDFVPYEKKTRGKVWKPKEKKKTATPLLPDDLSDVLDTASEDDLVELAGSYYSFCRVNYCFVSRKHPWALICCSSLTSLGSSLAGSSCCNLNETILKKNEHQKHGRIWMCFYLLISTFRLFKLLFMNLMCELHIVSDNLMKS